MARPKKEKEFDTNEITEILKTVPYHKLSMILEVGEKLLTEHVDKNLWKVLHEWATICPEMSYVMHPKYFENVIDVPANALVVSFFEYDLDVLKQLTLLEDVGIQYGYWKKIDGYLHIAVLCNDDTLMDMLEKEYDRARGVAEDADFKYTGKIPLVEFLRNKGV